MSSSCELPALSTHGTKPTRAPLSGCKAAVLACALTWPMSQAHAEEGFSPDPFASSGDSLLNSPDKPYRVRLNAELGIFGLAAHTIQFGKDGTKLDYVADGAQDNLYTFARASAEISRGRHNVILLFQPLKIETRELLSADLVVDEQLFPAGSVVNFTYGFPFYRVSYLYDLWANPKDELSVGGSLQIRNATIEFESGDGTLLRTNRDVGPVPILKARLHKTLSRGHWVGAEADAFYAPVRYLNGDDDSDVVGAIADVSVRGGVELRPGVEAFLNLRYVGGGGSGTSADDEGPGDGYTDNWIHLVALSLGFTLK